MTLDEAMQIIAQQQKDIEMQGKRIEYLMNLCEINSKSILKLCTEIQKYNPSYFED